MIKAVSLFLALIAGPAQALDLISPNEFEELSKDKTLYFSFEGTPFGAEQFFKGRRSLWQHRDGTCTAGAWHNDGSSLCFLYEDNLDLQCWQMYRRDGDIFVRADEAPEDQELKLDRMDNVPLPCIGPDLGV